MKRWSWIILVIGVLLLLLLFSLWAGERIASQEINDASTIAPGQFVDVEGVSLALSSLG